MSTLPELLPLVARAAIVMFVTMLVIRALLWLLNIRSPVIHRWSSVLVLAQGWLIAPLVIAIPWYDPPEKSQRVAPAQIKGEVDFTGMMGPAWDSEVTRDTRSEANFRATPWGIPVQEIRAHLWSLLQVAWFVGMIAISAAVVVNYLRFCSAAAGHNFVVADDQQQWQNLLRETQGPSHLPLRLTAAIGPLLCLLPRGYEIWIPRLYWQACTAIEREAIVRHELSHYRRGDVWKTWLMYLLALPQWFNPAAWWAIRNFQQAGEWLCDADAAAALPQRTDYLQALLRLVELQPNSNLSNTVAGQCAHAHPLLVRVRRLLSPSLCQDSLMNKLLFSAAVFSIALLPLIRIELVARAADPPAGLQAVKDRMTEFDGKLAKVKEAVEALKTRGAELKGAIEPKVEALTKLAEDPNLLSNELREKAKTFMGGDEKTQLEVVKDIANLASLDEQVLALGRVVKDSPHEAVRRLALQSILAKKDAGYPAVALSFESLNGKDRAFLALELNKLPSDDKLILLMAMAKNADEELLTTLLGLDLPITQRLMLIGALAESRKEDEKFAAQILDIGDKAAGDDGLLVLYAIAKSSSAKNAAAAVKHSVKRKADAWPVIVAAFKKEDKDCRVAVVRAAKELGGEGSDFLIKHALEDSNAELRAAAEEAVK
jgi:beta-lactamase regulating signal transducer with metallopeptidase domain